jgi:hypothetical protein
MVATKENRLTRDENNRLMDAILNCELSNLSEQDALTYINQRTGLHISRFTYYLRKRQQRQRQITEMATLRENRYAYKLVFIKRIKEIEKLMHSAQKDYDYYDAQGEDRRFFFYKQKLGYQILEYNKQLVDLYLLLRMLDSQVQYGKPEPQDYQRLPEPEAEAAGNLSQSKF